MSCKETIFLNLGKAILRDDIHRNKYELFSVLYASQMAAIINAFICHGLLNGLIGKMLMLDSYISKEEQ